MKSATLSQRPVSKVTAGPAAVDVLKAMHWTKMDQLYSAFRRELNSRIDWRHAPKRVHEVAKQGFEALRVHRDMAGQRFCDLGCGVYHPYGVSAVMFLNGAATTVGLDLNRADSRRAAEALADLLLNCLAFPDRWHWGTLSRDDFIGRVRRFDLEALMNGDLKLGLNGLPMEICITDIHSPTLPPESFDLMSSRAVLEHFLDFGRAAERLYELLRPGGVAYHMIDIVDHRAYKGSGHHFWSFLAEEDNWSDGDVNRLRSCELRPHFERVGFEILRYDNEREKLPAGFLSQVKGRFKAMPEEELAVTGVHCVVRKPAR